MERKQKGRIYVFNVRPRYCRRRKIERQEERDGKEAERKNIHR